MNAAFSMKRVARAVAQLALGSVLLHSGAASAISLVQAYEAALQGDPTFLSAVQDSIAGKEYAVLGRSSLLPQLSASYSASRVRADLTEPYIGNLMQTSHPVYLSHASVVQLRQPLFAMDSWARYKQGKAQTAYSDASFDGRLQEAILRVTGAYIDALFSTEQLTLATAQRDAYREQQKVNNRLFDAGEGTRTDMLETQAKLDLAEAQLLEALDAQQNTRATLAVLVGGADVSNLDALRDPFRIAPLPEGGFEALKQAVLQQNPDVRSLQIAIEIAKQEVNKQRSGHMPRLDFVGSYSQSNADTLNTRTQESTNRSIGIQLNIPLYAGGSVSAQTRQAVANQEKAKSDLQAKIDKVTLDLRKDYATVVSSSARIPALEKAVSSAKLLVTATERSIKGGVRINLDLLNAQQQLFTSQRDLAQARYNYLLSRMKVKGAVGTLGPEDVREIAGYFQ